MHALLHVHTRSACGIPGAVLSWHFTADIKKKGEKLQPRPRGVPSRTQKVCSETLFRAADTKMLQQKKKCSQKKSVQQNPAAKKLQFFVHATKMLQCRKKCAMASPRRDARPARASLALGDILTVSPTRVGRRGGRSKPKVVPRARCRPRSALRSEKKCAMGTPRREARPTRAKLARDDTLEVPQNHRGRRGGRSQPEGVPRARQRPI